MCLVLNCLSRDSIIKQNDMILLFYNNSYHNEDFFHEKPAEEDRVFGELDDRPWYKLLKMCDGVWISRNYAQDGFKIELRDGRTMILHCSKKWKQHDKLKILLGPTLDFYVGDLEFGMKPDTIDNEFIFVFYEKDSGKDEEGDELWLYREPAINEHQNQPRQ